MSITRAAREPPPKMSKRRQKYSSDENYRNRAKDLSRQSYRRTADVELRSCKYSLGFIEQIAQEEECVLPNKTTSKFLVLSIAQTADMLQRLYQTLWRWIQHGVIPAPILKVQGKTKGQYVYHIEEVKALIEEIANHEADVAYLRRDHHEARERIAQRILAVRKALKIER
jgi:hypothetical protein